MSSAPRILYLITARGGSKGVLRKSLRKIDGLSLIGYKVRAAARSSHCARLVISSEDSEMLAEGRRYGAEAPFVRPAELATDTARSDDVVLHALDVIEAEEGRPYDAVMLLEPSTPFATPEHLDRAVELYVRHEASLVVGMREVAVNSMLIGLLRKDGRADRIVSKFADRKSTRRQDMEQEYTMNGAFYLVERAMLRRTGRIYGDSGRTFGLVMDEIHSWEIETPLDLALAEYLATSGRLDTTPWKD